MEINASHPSELLRQLDRLHTTVLGAERVRRNLSLAAEDVAAWCAERIQRPDSAITRRGKNWYILAGEDEITVNARSLTIITAHKRKTVT